jgi:23S rRNA (guanosine2251-2'-O)-methyltransferase
MGCIVTRQGPLKPPARNRQTKDQFRRPAGRRDEPEREDGPHWLWGVHPVLAALANPYRIVERLLATRNAGARLGAGIAHEAVEPDALDALLPAGAVHQGLAARVRPLPERSLEDLAAPLDTRPILVLDSVTDPQNVGAVFRAAAAFEARGVIVQDRKSAPLTGVVAKAAVGALELVPAARVVNIARSVEALADLGYLTLALEGESDLALEAALDDPRPIALVIGAEGKGLRDLVAARCERRVRIPISAAVESLNVAAATAIALYAVRQRRL